MEKKTKFKGQSQIPAGLAAIAFACVFQLNNSQAALIAYDGFDYTSPNTVNQQNGGTGWSGGWYDAQPGTGANANTVVNSSGLTYASGSSTLSTQGGSAQMNASTTHMGQYRDLSSTLSLQGQTYYLGFLVRYEGIAGDTNPLDDGRYAQIDLYSGTTTLGSFGKNNTGTLDRWGMNPRNPGGAGTVYDAAGGPTVGNTAFLLIKLDYTNAQSATYTMWVNPDLSAGELGNTPDAVATRSNVGIAAGSELTKIRIGSNALASFDEIRLGQSWSDVAPTVPEPSTCAALAAGLGLFFIRRRK